MDKARVLIVQELWWPKGGGGILATHLITKVLVRHGFEVRVLTGAEEHEVIDNVVFIHEPRLRASNKIFDLLDTTTNLYTWISLLSILLVNS